MEEDSEVQIGVTSQTERSGEFIERSMGNSCLCKSVAKSLTVGLSLLVSRASSQEKSWKCQSGEQGQVHQS